MMQYINKEYIYIQIMQLEMLYLLTGWNMAVQYVYTHINLYCIELHCKGIVSDSNGL